MAQATAAPDTKGLALVSYDDEAEAKRVCAYLVKELTFCQDARFQVFSNPTPKAERKYIPINTPPYWYCREYIVGLPSGAGYWLGFTTSIERAKDCANDFLGGYRAAKEGR